MEVPPGTSTDILRASIKHDSSPVHEKSLLEDTTSHGHEHGLYAFYHLSLRIRLPFEFTRETDPVWEDHIEYCDSCEICKTAVRLWRTNPKSMEPRFRVTEFIVKRNGT